MNKLLILALAGMMAGQGAAIAATSIGIVTDNGKPVDFVQRNLPAGTNVVHKPAYPAILENFANKYPLGVYNASTGAAVSGPNTLHGQIWLATSFTPKQDATVKEIDVAAGYIAGTKNLVSVGMYADASGVPGTVIWSQKTALPTFSGCCSIVALTDKAGVPVTAGTRYWVGITTLANGSDTSAAWNLVVRNQIKGALAAQNRGSGWLAGEAVPNFAFGLYGD